MLFPPLQYLKDFGFWNHPPSYPILLHVSLSHVALFLTFFKCSKVILKNTSFSFHFTEIQHAHKSELKGNWRGSQLIKTPISKCLNINQNSWRLSKASIFFESRSSYFFSVLSSQFHPHPLKVFFLSIFLVVFSKTLSCLFKNDIKFWPVSQLLLLPSSNALSKLRF